MVNLIISNLKLFFSNKKIALVFSICLIINAFSFLMSCNLIINESYFQSEEFTYRIMPNDNMEMLDAINKIKKIEVDNVKIYFNDSIYVAYPNSKTNPNLGNKLTGNYEALISNKSDYKIGDYYEYGNNDYLVVGILYFDAIELSYNEGLLKEKIQEIRISNILTSNKKINEFKSSIKNIFDNCNIIYPKMISIKNGLLDSPIFIVLIGIIMISIISFFIGFQFFLEKREKSYYVYEVFGTLKRDVSFSIIIEIIILITGFAVVAGLIYFLLDILFINNLVSKIYLSEPFRLNFSHYLFMYLVYIIIGILSAIPSIVKLLKKNGDKL